MTDGGREISERDAYDLLAESVYHGHIRCECGYSMDLPDDADVEDARQLHNEHVREEHQNVETDGGEDILQPEDLNEPDSEELEKYRERREMFTCDECDTVADARLTAMDGRITTIWKQWVTVHTEPTGDGGTHVYFHFDEDAVDRGAHFRDLIDDVTEDVEPDPRSPPEDDRPDLDAYKRAASRQGRDPHTGGPRTDGGEPDPRMPVTLRDDAHPDVYETERCDGAGSDDCVREDPELTRGEDEIHVTNYGPGHSKSGRQVLCGECKDKSTALKIASDPEIARMYQDDELADLRERFPDILADVDIPLTDGGEDWTEQYATTTYRGPQEYPVPGGWSLGMVEMDGIHWKYYKAIKEGVDPDEIQYGPDARAILSSVYPEDADVMTDTPHHELKMDGEVVMELKDASEVDESEWWSAIAEILSRYDSGGAFRTVLSDMGLEHLEADTSDASGPEDEDSGPESTLDEFVTDGGGETVIIPQSAYSSQKRYHEDDGDGTPTCSQGSRADRNWKDKDLTLLLPIYTPCDNCYPDGHALYEDLTGGTSEDRILTDGGK